MTMRVAIVHDWLTGMRGGEKVLEGILSLYPKADVFTLLHVPGSVSPAIEAHPIRTSFLQRMPALRSHYRKYLLLFPRAIESLDFRAYDLVISSSHCVAKGARVPAGIAHVCYCHTPMRYIWDRYADYFGPGRTSLPIRTVMAGSAGWLRRWDVETSRRVTTFVANSRYVADRIRRIYDRPADVVYPWVDHATFTPDGEAADSFYLVLSALVPYKRVARLEAHATSNVEFVGRVDDEELRRLYRRCRALVFPGEEDFGIVPLEAMACGRPVLAYRAGGAMETVIEGESGGFFDAQTAASLAGAVRRFEPERFDPAAVRSIALRFDRERNLSAFRTIVERAVTGARDGELVPTGNGGARGTH
jgi:glycosyltransferase involved in cell wall biosynthesis